MEASVDLSTQTSASTMNPSQGHQSLALRYTGLNLQRRCFRLFHLEPLSFPDRLVRGHLEDYDFDNAHTTIPPYEAVSYAWGSDIRTETIQVDGKDLPVTHNLFNLLRHLAPAGIVDAEHDTSNTDKGHPRLLWIDAVCIDQYNPHEQSHQVQQMRDIYAAAARVVFYLGDPTADTNLLLTALGMLEQRTDDFGRQHADGLLRGLIWDEVQDELRQKFSVVTERQRLGLHDLLQRSWLRRVWIIHEVGNARDGVVQCGARTVSCSTFVLAPDLLKVDVEMSRQNILDAMPTPRRDSSWLAPAKHKERDLYHLLRKFHRAEAAVERDRIYALLGLCYDHHEDKDHDQETTRTKKQKKKRERASIVVDYNKSDVDVVRDTIAHICACSTACLPATFHRDIPSFLDNLYTLDSRVFSLLVQSSDFESLVSMMDERAEFITVTQSNLLDAVSNPFCGGRVSELLLLGSSLSSSSSSSSSPRRKDVHVTEDIVAAAARNKTQGLEVMQVLFKHRADEIGAFTESVKRAIIMNNAQGPQIAQLIRERTGVEVQITREILLDATQSTHSWQAIMSHVARGALDHDLGLLAEVVMAAVRKEHKGEVILQSLLEQESIRDKVEAMLLEERVLVAAAENETGAAKLFNKILTHSRQSRDGHLDDDYDEGNQGSPSSKRQHLVLPEKVLAACMRHPTQASALLDSIEQQQGISEMARTIEDSQEPDLWAFLTRPSRVRVLTKQRPGSNEDHKNDDDDDNDENKARITIDQGQPSLWWALRGAHVQFAKALLDRGANLDIEDRDLGFPILMALETGSTQLAELVLARGARVHPDVLQRHRSRYDPPLYFAASRGDAAMTKLLLDHGLSVLSGNDDDGEDDNDGDSAAGPKNKQTNFYGNTPLHIAAALGHQDVVDTLLSHRSATRAVKTNMVNHRVGPAGSSSSSTPLHEAARAGHQGIVTILLDHGADINSGIHDDSPTPLVAAILRGRTSVVRLLLERGAEVNTRQYYDCGKTPLHLAAERGYKVITSLLVAHGADLSARDGDGRTARDVALLRGSEEVVGILDEMAVGPLMIHR